MIHFTPEVTLARQVARTPVKVRKKPRPPQHKVTATGSTIGLPDLRAGVGVRIDGLGARYDGSYFVTETTHSFTGAGYRTRFVCERTDGGRVVARRSLDTKHRRS